VELPGELTATGREEGFDEVLARCYRHLGDREHSVAELRARLRRARFADGLIEQALALVAEQGYLDDARYTRLLVADRRAIDGWGRERIRARLQDAGIDRELIDQALAGIDHDDEMAAALAVLARRCSGPLHEDRDRQRAFAILVRLGYESELAYDAVRQARRAAAAR